MSSFAEPRLARGFLEVCSGVTNGTLTIIAPGGARHVFGAGAPEAEMIIHDWRVAAALAARGDIGLGETYAEGLWDSPDVEGLIALCLRNMQAFDAVSHGGFWRRMGFSLLNGLMRRNSRSGGRRNIMAHYDLGNAFYRLWLDETMTYSSALIAAPGEALEAAQTRKYDRLLAAAPGERVLEVGCGWGGFAERAVAEGRAVTGLTISPAQAEFARARLGRKAEIRLEDYRDARGLYESIVSIEMIEAVGERYWPTYFKALKDRLAAGGRIAIQAILVSDDLFPAYRSRSDYIRHHIFPGGLLPSPGALQRAAAGAGLTMEAPFYFGQSYAETLRRWRSRFDAAAPQIKALGFDERFLRGWRFYLDICAASFAVGRTEVAHLVFQPSEARA